MSETATDTEEKLPLQTSWTLWIFDPENDKKGKHSTLESYNTALKKIFTFDTIPVCPKSISQVFIISLNSIT